MSDCLPCDAIREALNFCGPWAECFPCDALHPQNCKVGPCPPGDRFCAPPPKPRPKRKPGPAPAPGGQRGYIYIPPPRSITIATCPPCPDGSIPDPPDCLCAPPPPPPVNGCEAPCGAQYCQGIADCCLTNCDQRFPGALANALCRTECVGAYERCVPPACPPPSPSGKPRTIVVPCSGQECVGCVGAEHDPPCADGECLDTATGCCSACGSTVTIGPPSLGYPSNALSIPSLAL